MNAEDLSGKRYGRLIAIELIGKTKQGNALWRCKCDCGKETIARASTLKSGNTQSCGCYRSEYWRSQMTKHGECNSRLAHIWYSMRARCRNQNNPAYRNYGGRGISVCKEWDDSFEAFREWALSNGYDPALSIDRVDNNGNYEPHNCRFADRKTQSKNRRPSCEWTFKNFKDWRHKKYKYPKKTIE